VSTLPTRADILSFIRDSDEKVGKREIARAFKIKGSDRISLKRLLNEMQEEGLIDGSRKGGVRPHDQLPAVTVIEIISLRDDGHLLARPIAQSSDAGANASPDARANTSPHRPKDDRAPVEIIVPPQRKFRQGRAHSLELAVGDQALARLTHEQGPRYRARIIKKLSSDRAEKIIGRVHVNANGTHLVSANRRDRTDYRLSGPEHELVHDTLIIAEKIPGRRRDMPSAQWIETIGPANHPHAYSLIAIAEQDLPFDFPPEVIREAEQSSLSADIAREDLTDLPFITIDPADARDHDDAVCASRTSSGFTLWVAIADVAAYVRPGSLLDREARRRGNSVYMPDRVIPMLPEHLSADLCSLRAHQERPALVAQIQIDPQGAPQTFSFHRATIKIDQGLSYEQAQAAFDTMMPGEDLEADQASGYSLENLWACYRAMAIARDKRAPLDLNRPEQRVVISDAGHISEIYYPPRLEAHRLIEEMMVAANVCAAKMLSQKNMPQLFRVHDGPERERLRNFADFVRPFGVTVDLGQTLLPRLFNHVLAQTDDPFQRDMVSEAVLRTQAQAVYATENIGHFGLNLSHYAHFTSPIRRYSDLLTHRALIAALHLGPDGLSQWDMDHLDETASLVSLTERKAMLAERTARERYLSAYMSDKIGETFEARISGLSRAGLFVRLQESGAEGLIPISRLGNEYFTVDEDGFTMRGSSGLCFRIGSIVEVQLRETLPLKGGIVFSFVSGGEVLETRGHPLKKRNPARDRSMRPRGKSPKIHKKPGADLSQEGSDPRQSKASQKTAKMKSQNSKLKSQKKKGKRK